jgi:hypothetical protein
MVPSYNDAYAFLAIRGYGANRLTPFRATDPDREHPILGQGPPSSWLCWREQDRRDKSGIERHRDRCVIAPEDLTILLRAVSAFSTLLFPNHD